MSWIAILANMNDDSDMNAKRQRVMHMLVDSLKADRQARQETEADTDLQWSRQQDEVQEEQNVVQEEQHDVLEEQNVVKEEQNVVTEEQEVDIDAETLEVDEEALPSAPSLSSYGPSSSSYGPSPSSQGPSSSSYGPSASSSASSSSYRPMPAGGKRASFVVPPPPPPIRPPPKKEKAYAKGDWSILKDGGLSLAGTATVAASTRVCTLGTSIGRLTISPFCLQGSGTSFELRVSCGALSCVLPATSYHVVASHVQHSAVCPLMLLGAKMWNVTQVMVRL